MSRSLMASLDCSFHLVIALHWSQRSPRWLRIPADASEWAERPIHWLLESLTVEATIGRCSTSCTKFRIPWSARGELRDTENPGGNLPSQAAGVATPNSHSSSCDTHRRY